MNEMNEWIKGMTDPAEQQKQSNAEMDWLLIKQQFSDSKTRENVSYLSRQMLLISEHKELC